MNKSQKSNSKSQNKNDQTLDDILAQNDEQMDKSHKTSKSGNADISGLRENDVSGLRMNTSLDRSQIAYQQMLSNSMMMMTPLNLSVQHPLIRSKSVLPPPLFEEPPKLESEFLLLLKKQILYLKDRLKEEIIFKLKLAKQNDMLKKTIVAKDQLIFGLNTQIQSDQYKKLLDDSKRIHDSYMVDRKHAELSARQMLKVPKDDDKSNRSMLSDNQYVSPDDQIPNKRLSIFDTSKDEADQTSQMEPNSLYYLEHNNSQAKGFNKPLQAKFKVGDKSGIGGLNASNLGHSIFKDTSQMNFTNLNMSKNTALRGAGDRSRFHDPPSQSRIMLFDDIMSGIDSSMQNDDELSRILFDKFNKSIISTLKPTKMRSQKNSILHHEKSQHMYDRSALGLPDDSFQVTDDRSMLRGLNLHNDQGLDVSNLFDKADESQLLKDVSRVNDVTCLISKDVTDLNNTNLYDASCLDSQLQDESCLVDKSIEVEKVRQIQVNQQNQQQNLMDQSLQVILEESQAENEITQDEINLTVVKTKKDVNENKVSPKSSMVNKLIGFFDKSNVDQSRVSQYEKNLGDQSAFDMAEAEDRFMQNRKSLDSQSISRSFIVPHKKPSKEQMQKLLDQRKTMKLQNKSNLSVDARSLKRNQDRSRTFASKKQDKSVISGKQDKSAISGKRSRSNTIHGYDAARSDNKLWKTKVDTLLAEKKNWLVERKELREQLRGLELQNDELMVRVKKVRKMMVDEDEALIGFKKMQQNYNEISYIAGHTSVIGANMMNQSYLPNDNSKLGMTAALDMDPGMIQNPMNVTGFTNLFGANQFNMDPQNLSLNKQPDEQPQDFRTTLAMNIKELEMQNNAAQQQIMNQTSFLLSTNGNNVYDNSVNISQNFHANDISAIPNIFGMVSQDVSQINFGKKADESNSEDGPSPGSYILQQRNTLEEVKKQQEQRKRIVVQGDNDEVEYNESPSVTISNKLDRITEVSRGAETSQKKNQSSGPKTQDRTHVQRNWKSGGSLQKTVVQENKNLPSQILEQQVMLREKILQNDEKINNLMEGQRRTADFNDFQALQLQDSSDYDPNKKEGFSNLFSFFKNKMRGSVSTEMQEAVEQYKPKMRGSSHGKRDSEREQAQRDSSKAQVINRNSDGDKSPEQVQQFKDLDDTPLRSGAATMNFNNLVGEKPRAKTNLDMFRGSIHEAMPGAMMPAQQPQQHIPMKQDQNKTFESFSEQKQIQKIDDADGPGFGANQISPGAIRSSQHESALKGSNSNSSPNNSMSKDDSRTSVKSNKFVSRIKKVEESKRITFNPTDSNDFQNQLKQNQELQNQSSYSNIGFPDKSKDNISIDFGHFAVNPIQNHKLLQHNDASISGILDQSLLKGSGDKNQSYISNIQRDQNASYIMLNQTNDLSMMQNSQYVNASFLGGGLNTSQFNKSKIQNKSPFFSDLKPKNTGESKIDQVDNLNQSSERFTLGKENQYSEEELQEIHQQQQYLQEQQMRQRVLQQQLLHQQALMQQQQQLEQISMQTAAFPMGSSLGASALGFMSQESINGGGVDSYLQQAYIQQNMMRQQQMIRQNQMQQYRESIGPGQLDKGQIRNMFLQMVGRNSNESPQKADERISQQQQMQQQQQLQHQQQLQQQLQMQQQQQMQQQHQQQEQLKGKQFFGNLISKKKQQQNQ